MQNPPAVWKPPDYRFSPGWKDYLNDYVTGGVEPALTGFERRSRYFILDGLVKDENDDEKIVLKIIRCASCGGEMAYDSITRERFCSKCGLVNESVIIDYGMPGQAFDPSIAFGLALGEQRNLSSNPLIIPNKKNKKPYRNNKEKNKDLMDFEKKSGLQKKRISALQRKRREKSRYKEAHRAMQIFYDLWKAQKIVYPSFRYALCPVLDGETGIIEIRKESPQSFSYQDLLNANKMSIKREYERQYGKIDKDIFYDKVFKKAAFLMEKTCPLARRLMAKPPALKFKKKYTKYGKLDKIECLNFLELQLQMHDNAEPFLSLPMKWYLRKISTQENITINR
jgi:hypothetical protein